MDLVASVRSFGCTLSQAVRALTDKLTDGQYLMHYLHRLAVHKPEQSRLADEWWKTCYLPQLGRVMLNPSICIVQIMIPIDTA